MPLHDCWRRLHWVEDGLPKLTPEYVVHSSRRFMLLRGCWRRAVGPGEYRGRWILGSGPFPFQNPKSFSCVRWRPGGVL